MDIAVPEADTAEVYNIVGGSFAGIAEVIGCIAVVVHIPVEDIAVVLVMATCQDMTVVA